MFELDDGEQPKVDASEYAVGSRGGIVRQVATCFDVDDVPRAELPRPMSPWMFHSTVYLFPLRKGVLSRWLLISAGLTPALVLVGMLAEPRWQAHGGWLAHFGLHLIGLPLGLLLLWTLAYASAVFLSILEETAAGADTIESWPDADWTDWLGQLVHLAYAVAVAGAVSFGIAWSSSEAIAWLVAWGDIPLVSRIHDYVIGPGLFVGCTLGVLCGAVPIVLLSTQQSSSGWLPLTRSVWRSMNGGPRMDMQWCLFQLAAAPLLLVPFAQVAFSPTVMIAHSSPAWFVLAAAGLGPQLAAAILIYARLLGRLAWEIGERLPDESPPEDEDFGEAHP